MDLINQYNYLLTLGIIVIFFGTIIITKKQQSLIKYQSFIAIGLALLQAIFFIWFWIKNVQMGFWYHNLLQDLCPAVQFISIIAFIWNKDKVYKAIMPWMIVGTLITMFAGSPKILDLPIFFISYGQHTIMLLQGIFAYLFISKYQKRELKVVLIPPRFPYFLKFDCGSNSLANY